MTSTRQETIAAVDCEVAFDNLSRQLYATDASIYQVEPMGVAFPRSARQASAVIQAGIAAGVSIIPRGAPGLICQVGRLAMDSSLNSRATIGRSPISIWKSDRSVPARALSSTN